MREKEGSGSPRGPPVGCEILRKRLTRSRVGISVLYVAFGFGISSWISGIPGMRQSFQWNPTQVGLGLFCAGIFSILMAIPGAKVVARYGSKRVAWTGGTIGAFYISNLPLLAACRNNAWRYAYLAGNGVANLGFGISLSTEAVELERAWEAPIMSSFHACWSLGAFLGSLGFSAWLTLGLSWSQAYRLACGINVLLISIGCSQLQGGRAAVVKEAGGGGESRRKYLDSDNFRVIALSLLGSLALLTEGSIGDWSGLFVLQYDGPLTLNKAPLPYAAYAAAMTTSRVFGDRINAYCGKRVLFKFGSALTCSGLLLFMFVNRFYVSLLACSLIGFGISNNVPILQSAVGQLTAVENRHDTPVNLAIFSVFCQTGILSGPSILGPIAHRFSLKVAFCVPLLAIVFMSLSSKFVAPKKYPFLASDFNPITSPGTPMSPFYNLYISPLPYSPLTSKHSAP